MTPTVCGPGTCVNEPSGYTCTCDAGYMLDTSAGTATCTGMCVCVCVYVCVCVCVCVCIFWGRFLIYCIKFLSYTLKPLEM